MAEPAPSQQVLLPGGNLSLSLRSPRRRARPLKSKLVWIGLAVVVLTGALLWVLRNENDNTKEDITWLTMAETAGQPPGAFTRLKFRILASSKRLWSLYAAAHKQMSMEASFLSYPEDFPPHLPLSVQTFTNADGMRAWVLSAAEWSELKAHARDRTLVAVRMTTMEGQESGAATGPMEVGFLPRVQHGKFNLRVRAVWARDTNRIRIRREPHQDGPRLLISHWPVAPLFRTAARCCRWRRVACSWRRAGENYWFTLSAMAIDSKGDPKK